MGALALPSYVDDVSIGATGDHDYVTRVLGDAFNDMAGAFRGDLGLRLAPAKGRVVASSASLARRVARVVGPTGGFVADVAPHLGVDAAAGKRRATCRNGAARDGRFRKAIGRVARVLRIRRAGGERAKSLAATGLKPQLAYGAEVHGLCPREAATARAGLLRAIGPSGASHSKVHLQLVVGDP